MRGQFAYVMAIWEILSDTDEHFTPAHLMSLGWTCKGDEVFLNYLERDMEVIKRDLPGSDG